MALLARGGLTQPQAVQDQARGIVVVVVVFSFGVGDKFWCGWLEYVYMCVCGCLRGKEENGKKLGGGFLYMLLTWCADVAVVRMAS